MYTDKAVSLASRDHKSQITSSISQTTTWSQKNKDLYYGKNLYIPKYMDKIHIIEKFHSDIKLVRVMMVWKSIG